ncbi:MAG: ABC transporter permease [Anaerolineae bacterium]|nr:ABC transporter permease [Anaerolineae bacterium]
MIRYIIRRLLQAIPTFFGITIISYALMSASGNPVRVLSFRPDSSVEEQERLANVLGVNDPWVIQYLRWLLGDDWMRWDTGEDGVADRAVLLPLDADGDGENEPPGERLGVVRGDFGNSFVKKRPVLDLIFERMPATLELSVSSLVIGTIIGLIIGIAAAVNRGKAIDNASRVIAVVFDAIPGFWLSLLLLLIFGSQLKLLPIGDRCKLTLDDSCPPIYERLEYMVLPVFVFATGVISGYSRLMRASMLDVLGQDYIRTALSKGLSNRMMLYRHAARNAMIPIATFLGPAITGLLGGAVVIETIFNYPGVGRTLFEAATSRDYPVVMAAVIYGALATILGYLISDILYAWIDPRIRFT